MNDFLDSPAFCLSPQPRAIRENAIVSTPDPGGLDPDSFTYRARVAMLLSNCNVTAVAAAIGRSRVVTSQAINHGLHEPTRRLVALHLGIAA